MKEQIITPEKKLNEMEVRNLSDAELKTLVTKMLKELSEDLKSIKQSQSETKDTVIEMTFYRETTVDWMKPRTKSVTWNIRGKRKKRKNKQSEEQEEEKRIQKNEDSISSLWDNFKRYNICIKGVPEEEKNQETGNLFEKITEENLPNLEKEIDMQVQEAQRIPNKIDLKRLTPRHIIIKMPKLKDKERLLKAAREKQFITYRGVPIRLSADFSKETLQARRGWQEIFKVMKGRKEPITKIAVPSKDIV